MQVLLTSCVAGLVVLNSSNAFAADENLGGMLNDGWRALSVSKHRTEKVCAFLDGGCSDDQMAPADVAYLTKANGLAFCVGSLWWRGDSKQWVCVKTNEASSN